MLLLDIRHRNLMTFQEEDCISLNDDPFRCTKASKSNTESSLPTFTEFSQDESKFA